MLMQHRRPEAEQQQTEQWTTQSQRRSTCFCNMGPPRATPLPLLRYRVVQRQCDKAHAEDAGSTQETRLLADGM